MKLVQVWLIVNPEKSGGIYTSTLTGTVVGGEGEAGKTKKLYVAKSLPGPHGSDPTQAVAVITYLPGPTLATLNESVRVPPEIVQIGGGEVATGLPDNEQTASVKENPEPVTVMATAGGGG